MSTEAIYQDTKLVKVITAQALNQRVDSADTDEASDVIKEMAFDESPNGLYRIAQTLAFTVNAMQKDNLDSIKPFADFKKIGLGDKAEFNVPTGAIRAYIQAKASTTPRSMVGEKTIDLKTIEVSARPAVNLYALRSGRANMADLARQASIAIGNKKLAYIQNVLTSSVSGLATPYYASGTGLVKGTFDQQLLAFKRMGGAVIMGDYAILDKLALLAGFTPGAGVAPQFSNGQIDQYHATGAPASYSGAPIVPFIGGYDGSLQNPLNDPAMLYILAAAASADQRNLKVVEEGDVMKTEATHIDSLLYEIRLDQLFGAAYIQTDLPTIGVYEDTTI